MKQVKDIRNYPGKKTERLDNLVAITGYNRDYICDYSPSMIGVFM